jgi:hypothetical protein
MTRLAIPISLATGAACAAVACAAPLLAQGNPAGSVTGRVIAAATGAPIPSAVVVLEAAPEGTIVVAPGGGSFFNRTLTAVTGPDGIYRFGALPRGRYRLIARHLGFHAATVEVDLETAEPFRLSLGLEISPIVLDAVVVGADHTQPYGRFVSLAEETRSGTLGAEQYRGERFLEGDATVITHADVTGAVTLGETDLFRALQRLPGVSTRDDFTAALWTRGAPWSQTRVAFDGLPLFNPVHALGLVSGLNPDAIGAATFHPGSRSVANSEGAAAVLNVTSRAAGAPGARGQGELSVASARASADWRSPGGRTGIVVAGRRSWVDLATRLAGKLSGDSTTYLPYAFYDVSLRLDTDVGNGVGIEAGALVSADEVRGEVRDLLRDTRGSWGNSLARLTLVTPVGNLGARHTVGVSRFGGRLRPETDTLLNAAVPHGRTTNTLAIYQLATEFSPAAGRQGLWRAGGQFQVQRQRYAGQYPRPYPVLVLPDTLALEEQLAVLSLWGERRLPLGRHAALEAGLRVEFHEPLRNAAETGVAPRLAARYTPGGGRLTVTGAMSRTFQYSQALAPAGPSVGPDLYLTDAWLLAGDTIPALRADVATLGAEVWLGAGWIVSLNGYARRATGMAVPEPYPGPLTAQRPIHVAATNQAGGLELSARRLLGRATAAVAWSWGRSEIEATSLLSLSGQRFRYPALQDRRHTLDAAAMLRLSDAVRVGAAFTAASGAPFSRFTLGLGCDTLQVGCSPSDTVALTIEQPNAARTPGYAAADLLFEWERSWGRRRVAAFLQLRNFLNLTNAVTYTGSVEQCFNPRPPRVVEARPGTCDRFNTGIALLPLAGVRISF